jgi:hypothetical protein
MLHEINFAWQARTAIESLDSSEREDVLRAIDRLRNGPHPPGLPEVHAVRGTEGLYVLRAGRGQRLRLLFTEQEGRQITIHDLVTHDLVQEYMRSVAQ